MQGLELLPQFIEWNFERSIRNHELLDRPPGFCATVERSSVLRIDDPDLRHAELAIIAEAALIATHAVLRRKHFDDDCGRAGQDCFVRLIDPQHRDVGNAYLLRSYSYPDLGKCLQLALRFMGCEPPDKERLDGRVLLLPPLRSSKSPST